MQLIASSQYTGRRYSHQGWLTPDHQYFLMNDELDDNLYINGDYAYESNYRAGLRIVDVKEVATGNLEEVAYFDTYPEGNGASFSGTWSNYPYFESGVIAISNIGEGLFLVK